ncbi:uncharacterized protein K452DRAFT_218679 [Aplosporella prunicola CBS 121167]|uniref:Vezatin n=1 Tax=Aplosporella prunicola CBS 121167 TaxID=1176127 RepID=A0A6A6BRD2_9PEZI|nr:uncharacterized protein K452DRAFT_218679 [Aplosporella prunicola CBS 121167]KAF2146570.1 hypothetical protein K452DRAFT_218679 [Aplosporella prunicola CBS 121167]
MSAGGSQQAPLTLHGVGEGTGETGWVAHDEDEQKRTNAHDAQPQSFAPRGPSTLQSKLKKKLPRPLRLNLPQHGTVHRLHSAYSRVVDSRLGTADNARFLEHFRYIIVASQLLSEHTGQGTFAFPSAQGGPQAVEYKGASVGVVGASATGAGAFIMVLLIHWATKRNGFSVGRLFLVVVSLGVGLTVAFTHVRRQWLQHLRHRVVNTASTLIANLQTFDTATSSALMLVQEVELVSRGYRLSMPMPPITRLDDKGQARRCARLRRILRSEFAATIPVFKDACAKLRALVEPDDLERYLDVYDITTQDMEEAVLGYTEGEFDDGESLKALRILQFRLATLRRMFLSSLLALEADGGRADFGRWRPAVEVMENVNEMVIKWCEKINRILSEEEQFSMPSPQQKVPATPDKERLRSQVRKLSELSQGIRGLQAKMQVLREESNKSLEESVEVTELGSSLMTQYDSLGTDLKSLVQAWESGKASLALNIDRHERRVSQASSSGGLRSPVPSLGGLTAVEENGSPSDALRALNGDGYSSGGSASDEEVFEAIALPRQRNTMTRDERIAKMHEDRARQQTLRESREATSSMMRELESVMALRPRGTGRRPVTFAGRLSSL